jgi:hypothetical protein
VLVRVVEFKEFVDDHSMKVYPLKQVLVVQKQVLTQGMWIGKERIRDETNFMHDNSWCCLFPTRCKNTLYVEGNKLHLSTWATGFNIEHNDEFDLLRTGQSIQVNGETERQQNLLFGVNELRAILLTTSARLPS